MTEFVEFLMDRLDMDEEEATEFASDLEDHGIETEEQFDEAYFGDYGNTYHPEREFAENFYEELGEINVDNPLYSFIDWQEVWDRQLRYDFNNINGHFFRNI